MLLILLMSKGSKVVFMAYIHNIDLYIKCYVKRVERLCYVKTRDNHICAHNFLNI